MALDASSPASSISDTFYDASSEFYSFHRPKPGLQNFSTVTLKANLIPDSVEGSIISIDSETTQSRKLEVDDDSERLQIGNDQFEQERYPVTASDQPPFLADTCSLGQFQLGQLITPKSQYVGYLPPLPVYDEGVAVSELKALYDQELSGTDQPYTPANDEFIEFELTDFTVYWVTTKHRSCEMKGLQCLATKAAHSSFLLNGTLTYGSERRLLQDVPFNLCSIGNYGAENHTVGSDIWIQSQLNSYSNVYYRLGTPSSDYQRYHEGFVWIANLGKHFVDFCEAHHKSVSIHNFKSDFSQFIKQKHGTSEKFQNWYRALGSEDFRRAVSVNIAYLFNESIGVNKELRSLSIWKELLYLDSIPIQPIVEESTIVTPFIHECFKYMRFGHHLKVIQSAQNADLRHAIQEVELDLTNNDDFQQRDSKTPPPFIAGSGLGKAAFVENSTFSESKLVHQEQVKIIKVGDVLAVTKDGEDSVWKDEVSRWKAADDCWYVYVQGVRTERDGKRSFDALWLYKPSDTSCARMRYPFPNELFLSDNCTCTKSRIAEEEILSIVPVEWKCHPSDAGEKFFIRQTYLENERFVTLKDAHKMCGHLQPRRIKTATYLEQYPVGQTVLARPRHKSEHELEVYEVDKYIVDNGVDIVMLRRLNRRQSIDDTRRPNELMYTDIIDRFLPKQIHAKCLVRFYSEEEVNKGQIPAPYSRDGTGNTFYITSKLVDIDGRQILETIDHKVPRSLIQGFDPNDSPNQGLLRGLDLYCGGGNFGRGLEEGGGIRNEWAVDLNKHAIHTYAANLKPTDNTNLFYGSVNDLLAQAMKGNPQNSKLIPLPGDVDFISAGSPCQGFSSLNDLKNDERGLKNQSMVASVAAYIDFYRPKYGLLENVMTMAATKDRRDEDVLSQLICSIVAMGYQTQVFVVGAWSCGGPQSRTRLFVSFAAPRLTPLQHPALSHSHPPYTTQRTLGKLANGQPIGERIFEPTPFQFVSAREATKDLPKLGDGTTFHCIEQPDHINIHGNSPLVRMQIQTIPRRPYGMNFVKAWNDGKGEMTAEERALFPTVNRSGRLPFNVGPGSKAWGRVHPDKLFPIISQMLSITDCRSGPSIHWDEDRMLTVMEGRRIQGYPDDEVLPGSPSEGWRRLGNSVSRQVALALGLAVREAWLKNEEESNAEPVANERGTFIQISLRAQQRDRTNYIVADTDDDSEEMSSRSSSVLELRSPGNGDRKRKRALYEVQDQQGMKDFYSTTHATTERRTSA